MAVQTRPTITVTRKSDGEQCVIAEADFDSNLYDRISGRVLPRRKPPRSPEADADPESEPADESSPADEDGEESEPVETPAPRRTRR